jgi:hypothetical protein
LKQNRTNYLRFIEIGSMFATISMKYDNDKLLDLDFNSKIVAPPSLKLRKFITSLVFKKIALHSAGSTTSSKYTENDLFLTYKKVVKIPVCLMQDVENKNDEKYDQFL